MKEKIILEALGSVLGRAKKELRAEFTELLTKTAELIAKRLDAIQLTPGPAGADGRDGADGKDADPAEVAAQIKADEAYRASLKGDQGQPGRDGADGKDAAPEAVYEVLKADEEFVSRLKGERGEKGEPGKDGTDGRDGADADPDVVLSKLISDEVFVSKVSKTVEQEPWQTGINREGKFVSHYVGRSYQAVCDTTDEPGDSPHWKRIGTLGFRDTGGYSEQRSYEPGDFYHKDGSTFFFDGVNHRLFMAKPVTAKDMDKAVKTIRSLVSENITALLERVKVLETLFEVQRMEIEELKGRLGEEGSK